MLKSSPPVPVRNAEFHRLQQRTTELAHHRHMELHNFANGIYVSYAKINFCNVSYRHATALQGIILQFLFAQWILF